MARYDVYKNPDALEARDIPFFLDVQNSFIDASDTVVLVPLRKAARLPFPAIDLNPLLEVKGQKLRMDTCNLAAVPRRALRSAADNLSAQQVDIQNALDTLFGGY